MSAAPGGTDAVPRRIHVLDLDRTGDLRSHSQDTDGAIAAWAADEDRLGRHAAVDRYLAARARAGHLRSFAPNPGGTRFIAALHRFLKRSGYPR